MVLIQQIRILLKLSLTLSILFISFASYSQTCSEALDKQTSFLRFTGAKADAWDASKFSDPKNHNENDFMYMVNAPKFSDHGNIEFHHLKVLDRLEGNLSPKEQQQCIPQGTICTSVISNEHPYSFLGPHRLRVTLNIPKSLFAESHFQDSGYKKFRKPTDEDYDWIEIGQNLYNRHGLESPQKILEKAMASDKDYYPHTDVKIWPGPGTAGEQAIVSGIILPTNEYLIYQQTWRIALALKYMVNMRDSFKLETQTQKIEALENAYKNIRNEKLFVDYLIQTRNIPIMNFERPLRIYSWKGIEYKRHIGKEEKMNSLPIQVSSNDSYDYTVFKKDTKRSGLPEEGTSDYYKLLDMDLAISKAKKLLPLIHEFERLNQINFDDPATLIKLD